MYRLAKSRFERAQRCVESIRKVMPSLPKEAQQRERELLAKCQ